MIAAKTICDGIETGFGEIPKTVGLTYTDHYVTRSWRGRRAFHILLVEQETHFLDALQKMLDANYQVSSARTVLEAQAIVQTSHQMWCSSAAFFQMARALISLPSRSGLVQRSSK
jgi:hypothetical protein